MNRPAGPSRPRIRDAGIRGAGASATSRSGGWRLAVGAAALLGLFWSAATPLRAQNPQPVEIQSSALLQIEALMQDKVSWSEAERKLDSSLLFALKRLRGDDLLDRLPDLRTGSDLRRGEPIELQISGRIDQALLIAVEQMGGEVLGDPIAANRELTTVPARESARVRLPLEQVLALAERSDVQSVRRDLGFELRKVNTSEGDVAHQADLARSILGVDGNGIKIGVLSDGVDTLAARQATGDLPPGVNVIAGQAGSGDEGTAMLEIVHDLAPGATLYFATGIGGEAQFAANITALQNAGCRVIVDDLFYFAEATFQDDVVAQAVDAFTDAGGLYFSSAGNSGNLNDGSSGVWEGDFSSASVDPPALSAFDTHDFGAGSANVISSDSPSFFILQWSDALGASGNDYDLILLDPAGSTIFDAGETAQDGNDDPFEFIDSRLFNDAANLLAVVRSSGAARFLHLGTNRGELAQATDGETSGHATAANAFGVAAVDWFFAGGESGSGVPFDGSESVETFSSDGPRRIFYDATGAAITPGDFLSTGGEVRNQPKVAAADGVSTAAPGFNPFFGTSAAAPHAAAIAALLLENGNLTPTGLEALIAATALDIEAAGLDRDSGYGIFDALGAINTTLPGGLGGTPPSCVVDDLVLTGVPNDGPQTFRACQTIHAYDGRFDDLTLIAYDTLTATGGTITLSSGFVSMGPLVLRTSAP